LKSLLTLATLACLLCLLAPMGVVADGSGGGDPPMPDAPTDSVITAAAQSGVDPGAQITDTEQTVWDEILSLLIFVV